jgi:hypothetical protein
MAGAVREVVKYCTKLTDVSAKEREDGESDVLELHRAIRGRRLLKSPSTVSSAVRGRSLNLRTATRIARAVAGHPVMPGLEAWGADGG